MKKRPKYSGAITPETADAYNARALKEAADALYKARLAKLPLLIEQFGLVKDDYAGLVRYLAAKRPRKYAGDIRRLKAVFGVNRIKPLAVAMAVEIVPGFKEKRPVIKPEKTTSFCDIQTRQEHTVIHGAIRAAAAEGRPETWDTDRLNDLLNDFNKLKEKNGSNSQEILLTLTRRQKWRGIALPTMRLRLHEAKHLADTDPEHDEYVRQRAQAALKDIEAARKKIKKAKTRKIRKP